MLYQTAVVVSVNLDGLDSKRYSMQGWRGQLGWSAFVKPRYPSVLEVEGGASCMLRMCHGVPRDRGGLRRHLNLFSFRLRLEAKVP